jgi:hypothetical protein
MIKMTPCKSKKYIKKFSNHGNLVDMKFFTVYTNSMYIKLTNASPQHRGNNIGISSEHVVTVHSSVVTREEGTVETVTFVFCPPHGTWEVSESFDHVVSMLNQAQRGELDTFVLPVAPPTTQLEAVEPVTKPKRATRVKLSVE